MKNKNLLKSSLYNVVLASTLVGAGISSSYGKVIPKEAMTDQPAIEASSPGILKKHSVGIGVGQTFLNGDMKKLGQDEITGDLFYSYSASYSFDFIANFHYSKHTYLRQEVKLPGLDVGIKAKLYQFDNFAPYILGGMGFYRPQVKRYLPESGLTESQGKVTFGYHIGAGADLRLNEKVSVGLLAHYHNPFDVKQELGPDVEGSYFKLLITSMYTF